ncbi:MAG: Nif3-like dinuclear metal center hexameric protein [Chthoniobacterales bacterium]
MHEKLPFPAKAVKNPSMLRKMVDYMDAYLRMGEIKDYPTAFNGLQVENSGRVKRIVAAVDACEATIQLALEAKADLLIVHHGLFWSGAQPVTGAHYRKLKAAMDADLAIYSAHLPLDSHPRIGNNALLAKAISLRNTKPFFETFGSPLGLKAEVKIDRSALHERICAAVSGPVHLCPGGPEKVRSVGIVTGGAGGEVARAAAEGIDTFITGEGPHWSYTLAEELGVNIFYAGHYATETFGVKALAALLAKKFNLPWEFLDHPTGL